MGAEVPLEVADPEDEVGDGGGAGADFDAAELVGVDGEAGVFDGELGVGELGEEVVDLAFEAFEVFEGDVEEVSGAAGGVEDGDGAEVFEEFADVLTAFLSSPSLACWMAAVLASAHSSRRGSMTVGRRRRST